MQILIIDDDRALCRSLQIHLERLGHQVDTTHLGTEGINRLRDVPYDLAFIDLDLPDTTGLEILRALKDAGSPTLSVMITGIQDAQSTIDAIRLGAFDYIRKPLDLDAIVLALEKVGQQRAQGTAQGDTQPLAPLESREPHEIIGSHPSVIELLKQVALVAESGVPVLIQGESGTGKELVARALHQTGRPGRPFVAVNCSAVVPTLLESELFGHVRGAFTGADTNKTGRLESAGEGTVFFDEIGDMGYDLQAKLLRVLQEREFEPVGSTRTIPFRARVIAATHRDLKALVTRGEFREDLYYRLAVSTFFVPPLRERRSDIPVLVEHMLARIARELHKDVERIDRAAMSRCEQYDWPGNIRELSNVLTRSVLLARSATLTDELIASSMGRTSENRTAPPKAQTLREAEKEFVFTTLVANGWNIKRTAAILDISRVTLRKKIEDYGLVNPAGTRTD